MIFALAIGPIVSLCVAQENSAGLQADSRLQVKISMRLKIVSLSAFAQQLQSQTKAPCSVANPIADRKITAIFHDRPACEVMVAVENAMFMQWVRVGDGYRLTLPAVVNHEEQAQVAAEAEEIRARLIDQLKDEASPPETPQEEIDMRRKEIRAQIKALSTDPRPEARTKLADLYSEESGFYEPYVAGMAKALLPDLAGNIDRLLEGKTLFASTLSMPFVTALAPAFQEHVNASDPDAASVMEMIRYDPDLHSIERKILTVKRSPPGLVFTTTMCPAYAPPAEVKSSKLIARLARWSGSVDEVCAGKGLSGNPPAETKPGYVATDRGPGLTLADHLELISDQSDTPVIADAFRVFCSDPHFGKSKTIKDYMAWLKGSVHSAGSPLPPVVGYWTTKNGWLLVRHQAYWRRLAYEIPESVLQPMEAVAQGRNFPSTDEYAAFAGALTFEQSQMLRPFSAECSDIAVRFRILPVVDGLPSLKLWASLTEEQRAAARGDGLELELSDPLQAPALLDYWADRLWSGAVSPELWGSVFSSGASELHPILKQREIVSDSQEDISFECTLSSRYEFAESLVVTKARL